MPRAEASGLAFAVLLALSACAPQVEIGAIGTTTGAGSIGPLYSARGTKVLATGLGNANAIAYLDQNLYVATTRDEVTSSLVRISLSGGAPTKLASSLPLIWDRGIAVDATHLYWSGGLPSNATDGTISSMPIEGGTPTLLVPSGVWGTSLTIDLSYLYWGGAHGSVFRMPLAGGDVTTLFAATEDDPVEAIAVDDANVYWGGPDSEYVGSGSTVMKAPIGGGTPTVMAHVEPGYVRTIAPLGGYIYVAHEGNSMAGDGPTATGNGSVFRVPIDQSTPIVALASNQPMPAGLAVDASGVYWGGGSLGPSVAQDLGVPVNRIATDGAQIDALVPTGLTAQMVPCLNAICWVDGASGTVMRYEECEP